MVKKYQKKSQKNAEPKEKFEIDFGLGKIGLGGIFDGIEKLVRLAEKVDKAGGEIRKSGEIKGLGGKEGIRGVYGFTIRTGLGKKGVTLEPFGNIRATKKGPEVAEVREPITDVFDEKDQIVVIAELPGVDEKTIHLADKDDVVIIEAGSDKRKFAKEILLPAKVDFDSKTVSFKNGILEVRFRKK